MKKLFLIAILGVSFNAQAQLYAPEIKVQQTTDGRIEIGAPALKKNLLVNGQIESNGLNVKHESNIYSIITSNSITNGYTTNDPDLVILRGNPDFGKSVLKIHSGHELDEDPAHDYGDNMSLLRITRDKKNGGPDLDIFRVTMKGNVCIGRLNPYYYNGEYMKLNIEGKGYIKGGVWEASDRKLKKNIKKYDKGLQIVKQINTVSFDYLTDPVGNDSGEIGIVAQDLQEIMPNLVRNIKSEDGEDFLAIKPSHLTYLLINAIKELDAKVEEQQQLINKLQNEKK